MQAKNNSLRKSFKSFFLGKRVIIPMILLITFLCLAASLSSNNTFIIYDGETKTVYNSSQTKTADFIKESGIEIGEDKYFEMPESAEDGIARIYVKNKNALTLTDNGTKKTLYALNGETVSDVLSQNGITLGNEDKISVPVSQEATDGLSFEIVRVTHSTFQEIQSIPYTTEKRASSKMNKGTSKVLQEGVNGSKTLVYDIKSENGKDVSKTLISETVTKEPVKKIVEYGTKVPDTSGVVKTWSGEMLKYKKVLNMTATAYTTERTSDKITATGKVAKVGLVAVDKRVIPLGSKLYIVSADGKSWCYGIAVAADTGVRGNKIDLFFDTYKECINFGRRKATVYILK